MLTTDGGLLTVMISVSSVLLFYVVINSDIIKCICVRLDS